MKRLGISILAAALAANVGAASAQDYRSPYGDAPYGSYPHRTQSQGDYDRSYQDRYQGGYGNTDEGSQYDWARVVRVDPVIAGGRGYPTRDGQRCETRRDGYAGGDGYGDGYYRDDDYDRDDRYARRDPYRDDRYRDTRRDENGRMVATVLGGIAGAVLGSKIGDGSGQYIGTAVGSMVGGMAGRGIYDSNRRARDARDGYVTVCEPDSYRGDGYRTGDYRDDGVVEVYDVTYEYGGRRYTTRTGYHPGDRIRVRVDVRAE